MIHLVKKPQYHGVCSTVYVSLECPVRRRREDKFLIIMSLLRE